MLFSLATSWENNLIDNIAALNRTTEADRVFELYGSLPYSLTGSGRSGQHLPQISEQHLAEHVQYACRQGLEFNYTMNAPDFGGREHDKDWLSALREHLASLRQAGVARLTISNTFLIELVAKEFNDFHVNVSVVAGVDTPERAVQYEQMGVECIVLNHHTANRDFEMLAAIREKVHCRLELFANTGCVAYCPNRNVHYSELGKLSQLGTSDKEYIQAQRNAEKCTGWCTRKLLLEPVELLKVPFIRPEDIREYETIGIDVIKLADRMKGTAWLTNIAQAYLKHHYTGNLFNLFYKTSINDNIGMFLDNTEQYTIELAIDNQKLTEYNFLNNLKKFTGKDREDYYASILNDVVSGYDHPDMHVLRKEIQSS